ncbi:MAG TPA: histidinol-phosphate transaminase [Steroidobacteraceae bacterium]|nr:histidinol-phosphate transaminase [Steroidobacteraceae bacterium]
MSATTKLTAAHPGQLATAAVRALSPYVPGKPISELQREYGISDVIKLASNENPYGPSPLAIAAIRAAIADAWLYPDGSAHELKRALGAHLAVPVECLTLGNGSNELLLMLAETFLDAQHSAVCSQYGFAIYPLVIRATGATCLEAPAHAPGTPMPYGHDPEAMLRAIRADTRLVFIANPNNPTGTWVGHEALEAFIEAVPAHALVVLDEAYLEFAELSGVPSGLPWLADHPNLVVLRTFSKGYGLAGLRIGYAVSHPEVADAMNRYRPAFNVGNLAQAAAIAALQDPGHVQDAARRIVAERARVATALRGLGLACVPSAGNFLMVDCGAEAAPVYEQLLRGGVIVRPIGGYGLPRHLRISIGLPEHNDRLLKLLAKLVPAAPAASPA